MNDIVNPSEIEASMNFTALIKAITGRKIKGDELNLANMALTQPKVDELLSAIDTNHEYKRGLRVLKFGNTAKTPVKKRNQFTRLLLDGYTSLEELEAAFVGLTELTMRNGAENLKRVYLSHNHLTSFPAPQFTCLSKLDLSHNAIPMLDVSGLEAFSYLNVNGNPLVTLLFAGTYFTDGIHYDSTRFDAVTLRSVNQRRERSSKLFTDHNPNRLAVQIAQPAVTADTIEIYIQSMFNAYKQFYAPNDLNKMAHMYKLLVKGSKDFAKLPDDIIVQILAHQFADLVKEHFVKIRANLQITWNETELQQFDRRVHAFVAQSYRSGCKMLMPKKATKPKETVQEPASSTALVLRRHKGITFSGHTPGNVVSGLVKKLRAKLKI